jgi:rhamnosyltransferase
LKNSTIIAFICFNEDKDFYRGIEELNSKSLPYIIYFNSHPKNPDKLKELDSKYILNDHNVGISIAMNRLFKYAIDNDYEHLLFFDQDTIFLGDDFNFISTASKLFEKNKKIAAINIQNQKDLMEVIFEEKMLIINSCTIFHMDRVKKIGFFNEDYFVEYADYEFCLRCLIKHYKVGILRASKSLDHFSNQGSKKLNLLFFKVNIRIYPHSRVEDLNNAFRLIFKKCFKNFKIKFLIKMLYVHFKWHIKHFISKIFYKII